VIDQERRRVLNGKQVPTAEKIYAIFEPHTDLIKRGKVRTPVEFGHKGAVASIAARPQAMKPFMSDVPRAKTRSWSRRRRKGSEVQASPSTGTTAPCADSISPPVAFGPIEATRHSFSPLPFIGKLAKSFAPQMCANYFWHAGYTK
jgi:hypothetical protein